MKPLSECRLYAFVDTSYLHGRSPELVAQQLCEGGADLIQLRAKNSSAEEIQRTAEKILPITTRAGIGLVINDYPEIASRAGAEYCHLGQEDFFESGRHHVSELSKEFALHLGLSTHSPQQAELALAAGADYIAVGPVFATSTKPKVAPVTLDYVRWASANVQLPWFVIGGIHLGNLHEVWAAGARRFCVVSAILNAPDVIKACKDLKKALEAL